jgi:hypothetical protein
MSFPSAASDWLRSPHNAATGDVQRHSRSLRPSINRNRSKYRRWNLQRIEQRFLAPARKRLGDDEWECAGDGGRRLTTEQAIAFALEAADTRVRG